MSENVAVKGQTILVAEFLEEGQTLLKQWVDQRWITVSSETQFSIQEQRESHAAFVSPLSEESLAFFEQSPCFSILTLVPGQIRQVVQCVGEAIPVVNCPAEFHRFLEERACPGQVALQ